MKLLLGTLALAGLLFVGCTEDVADPPPPPDTETIGEALVPDVEHANAQEAYEQLRSEGFRIRFAADIHPSQRKYVKGEAMMNPELWVNQIEPSPGSHVTPGSIVTIVSLECPDGLTACD
ncbi:MAG: PASTA domain-containing protein [Actinobacteria bacterium]|nr:PASTA domain-containing protein [Actinomycetota bacterium]